MKIYLANCLGFYPKQRARRVPEMVSDIRGHGIEVHEPLGHVGDMIERGTVQSNDLTRIAEIDLESLSSCDAMIATTEGSGDSTDPGVCIEVGYAIAKGIRVFVVHDRDIERPQLNAMFYAPGISIHDSWESMFKALLNEFDVLS